MLPLVLYKVFVCGDKFHVVTRPSITLHKLKRQEHQVDSYNFHSDTVSKVNAQSTSQAQEVRISILCFVTLYSGC